MGNSVAFLKQKVFEYVWYADSARRATIAFEWNAEQKRFVFDYCAFSGVNKGSFDFDDWSFLKDLSAEIVRLNGVEGYEGGTHVK